MQDKILRSIVWAMILVSIALPAHAVTLTIKDINHEPWNNLAEIGLSVYDPNWNWVPIYDDYGNPIPEKISPLGNGQFELNLDPGTYTLSIYCYDVSDPGAPYSDIYKTISFPSGEGIIFDCGGSYEFPRVTLNPKYIDGTPMNSNIGGSFGGMESAYIGKGQSKTVTLNRGVHEMYFYDDGYSVTKNVNIDTDGAAIDIIDIDTGLTMLKGSLRLKVNEDGNPAYSYATIRPGPAGGTNRMNAYVQPTGAVLDNRFIAPKEYSIKSCCADGGYVGPDCFSSTTKTHTFDIVNIMDTQPTAFTSNCDDLENTTINLKTQDGTSVDGRASIYKYSPSNDKFEFISDYVMTKSYKLSPGRYYINGTYLNQNAAVDDVAPGGEVNLVFPDTKGNIIATVIDKGGRPMKYINIDASGKVTKIRITNSTGENGKTAIRTYYDIYNVSATCQYGDYYADYMSYYSYRLPSISVDLNPSSPGENVEREVSFQCGGAALNINVINRTSTQTNMITLSSFEQANSNMYLMVDGKMISYLRGLSKTLDVPPGTYNMKVFVAKEIGGGNLKFYWGASDSFTAEATKITQVNVYINYSDTVHPFTTEINTVDLIKSAPDFNASDMIMISAFLLSSALVILKSKYIKPKAKE